MVICLHRCQRHAAIAHRFVRGWNDIDGGRALLRRFRTQREQSVSQQFQSQLPDMPTHNGADAGAHTSATNAVSYTTTDTGTNTTAYASADTGSHAATDASSHASSAHADANPGATHSSTDSSAHTRTYTCTDTVSYTGACTARGDRYIHASSNTFSHTRRDVDFHDIFMAQFNRDSNNARERTDISDVKQRGHTAVC